MFDNEDFKRNAILEANESIPEMIRGYSLFSNKMVCAFEDKDLMAYTLKALSVMDVTEEMKNEMEISTEFWRKCRSSLKRECKSQNKRERKSPNKKEPKLVYFIPVCKYGIYNEV